MSGTRSAPRARDRGKPASSTSRDDLPHTPAHLVKDAAQILLGIMLSCLSGMLCFMALGVAVALAVYMSR